MSSIFERFYQGKKVFITGHTGFKGSWLSKWLLELGAQVAGYSNNIPTQPSHFELLSLQHQIVNYFEDIRNLTQLSKAINEFKPDIIFHLAAQPLVRRSFTDPHETFEVNVQGMVNLLEALRQFPYACAAVLVTSDKCYENHEWEYGYRETDQLGGKDPYSASKGASEIVAHSYRRSYFANRATQIATVRAGNVIGGGDWAADRLIPDCVKAWGAQQAPQIRNLHATRPWQHVLEPLSGYLHLAAELCRRPNQLRDRAFNFGPQSSAIHSVADVLATAKTYWPHSSFVHSPDSSSTSAPESTLLHLCCDRAYHQLQWYPTLSFQETLQMTISWYHTFYCISHHEAAQLTCEQIACFTRRAQEKNTPWATGNTSLVGASSNHSQQNNSASVSNSCLIKTDYT